MPRAKKISLEEYLDFTDNHKQIDLTLNYLNQIISMHGFRKIFNTSKKVLIDAVNSVDLIDPSRSTLEDNISSCAFITLEEVIKDLADLNWQECSVTSMQTLNSVKYDLSSQNADSLKPTSRTRKRRQRKVRRSEGVDGVITSTVATGGVGGSQSVCSSEMWECGARKKNGSNDEGFGASFGDFSSSSSTFVSLGSQ
ncbi:hypothetical protein F0562_008502 [Nyssa sinensis]|uniref:DUF7787 domain-containing protein n=1 Tax=Nyssa sinensis TaxID=561372 RepID=A0A5J5A5A0_9ASTE|nr:hypothetical protein F0562_008502 [Nyssa sinensis]